MRVTMFILCFLAVMIGCAANRLPMVEYRVPQASNYGDVLSALNEAEAKWGSAAITNYSCRILCGGVFGGTEYKATYGDGFCHASYIRDLGLHCDLKCDEYSMSRLFAEVRKAVNSKYGEIYVSFDPKLGYVKEFVLRPNRSEPDDAWIVQVSHFKAGK